MEQPVSNAKVEYHPMATRVVARTTLAASCRSYRAQDVSCPVSNRKDWRRSPRVRCDASEPCQAASKSFDVEEPTMAGSAVTCNSMTRE